MSRRSSRPPAVMSLDGLWARRVRSRIVRVPRRAGYVPRLSESEAVREVGLAAEWCTRGGSRMTTLVRRHCPRSTTETVVAVGSTLVSSTMQQVQCCMAGAGQGQVPSQPFPSSAFLYATARRSSPNTDCSHCDCRYYRSSSGLEGHLVLGRFRRFPLPVHRGHVRRCRLLERLQLSLIRSSALQLENVKLSLCPLRNMRIPA